MTDRVTIMDAPNTTMNKLAMADLAAHDWYRFVLSYPPHLVRHYVNQFGLNANSTVLDPFCGTGTTIVEAKKQGIPSVGIEAHPMTWFASTTKTDWAPNPERLLAHATEIAEQALAQLAQQGIADSPGHSESSSQSEVQYRSLDAEPMKLLLKDSISARPLHKVLTLLDVAQSKADVRYAAHERLALAKALVDAISNLHFGPEVGIGPAKADAAVIAPWLANIRAMAEDLRALQREHLDHVPTSVIHADARNARDLVAPRSIDAVICSPPYPNEKDYTRTTRLESVLLGFFSTREELQLIKRGLVRSNTRTVYKGDDDDKYVIAVPEIQRIANEIEARRIELGKTSGFERQYHRVTRLYFGGMAKHVADLREVLTPGAQLAYVVGDQASFLGVMIRTGQLLAEIAESLGYDVINLDLFRTRLATATREQLREEVVVLRWPGR